MQTDIENNEDRNKLGWFMLLVAPFILNDFSNIFIADFKTWLVIDYLFVKAFPLFLIVYLLRTRRIILADLGLKMIAPSQLVLWTIAVALLGTAIDQIGWRFFENVLPSTKLGGMPRISIPWLNMIDLYFGLICVGIFEEIIFRGLAFTVFRAFVKSTTTLFLITALLFGFMHWSLGLHAIVNTAIIGAVFMVVMWRKGSVMPTIIAHFLVNYVAFSGMIPYNSPWFDFLK